MMIEGQVVEDLIEPGEQCQLNFQARCFTSNLLEASLLMNVIKSVSFSIRRSKAKKMERLRSYTCFMPPSTQYHVTAG